MIEFDPFPARHWLFNTNWKTMQADAYAGFTNAAIVLPQGVAFATIAGLPPEYGLYTAMITATIAALFGSSMVMISGPTTAISAVLFATLGDMAEPNTARFIELALVMTILVGLFQLAGGLARLGGLVSFVSHSVMSAFTAAAAVLIFVSQLAGATGLQVERGGNVVERLEQVAVHLPEFNVLALTISFSTLVTAILLTRFAPKLPGFLIALVAGSYLAWLLDAANNGVSMVSPLSAALPTFAPPSTSLTDLGRLAPGAAAIALVGLLEAISIGRAFAVRRGEAFDPNQEMIGQGMSNALGGFFQCYAGSGSFTRSGVNAASGAKTPWAALFASAFLMLILVFVAPLVVYIPTPAMAGLILFVAIKLIDVKELRHIISSRGPETVILGLTLAAGLLIELDFAIYIGVIASLCVFIYETAHPELPVTAPVVSPNGDRKFRNAETNNIPQCPQLVTMRLDGPLYFGSVETIAAKLKKIRAENPRQIHMVLYLTGVGKIDLAGADLLIGTMRECRSKGGSFRIVANHPPLISSLYRLHVIAELGEPNLHTSKGVAVAAATKDLDRRICKGCVWDVYRECDSIREEPLK